MINYTPLSLATVETNCKEIIKDMKNKKKKMFTSSKKTFLIEKVDLKLSKPSISVNSGWKEYDEFYVNGKLTRI